MSLAQRVLFLLADGREIETTYDGRDLRAWEAEKHLNSLGHEMDLTDITWLTHHAAVRTSQINGDLTTFEAFDEACVSVQGMRDPEPVPPGPTKPRARATRKRVGGDSSAPSP